MHTTLPLFILTVTAGAAAAQPLYNLSELTALSHAAVRGDNVESPVRGFELLILKDGRKVYRGAFGEWGLGQVGNADSATKTISGAVIMALTDSSPTPFSLDTRLSDYIPEFDGAKRAISIRQSFCHNAGFGHSGAEGDRTVTLHEAALQIADETLRYRPGTTFDYGGTSMHAAGAVAEVAAGVPWNTLFQQRIGIPLGMASTRYILTSPTNPRIAGGCESNAEDFGRFMEMLRMGGVYNGVRVLSAPAVHAMLTRQTPLDVVIAGTPLEGSADYGVGIWLDHRHPDGTLEGAQAAGARGFSAWIDLDDGITGVFSTDLTQGHNIRALIERYRAAAQAAIRSPRACPADYNADGFLDFFDYDGFVGAYTAGDPDADYNGDDFIDFFDYFAFMREFSSGC